MFTKAFREELLSTQTSLIAKLNDNPDFQALQAVNQMLELCGEVAATGAVKIAAVGQQRDRNTKEELAAMNLDAKRYQAQHGNKPIAVKDLTKALHDMGHVIKGTYPGTTFGAVLSGRREEWEQKGQGLWGLTDQELAATRKRLQNETAGVRPAA